jgi:triacylglycerol lipase
VKLFALLLGCCGMFATARAATPPETVVLLHGMGRSHISMLRLEWELERQGYHVLNVSYPSRTQPLEALAAEWLPRQLAKIAPESRVHFVTHSMGGILVRLWRRECVDGKNAQVRLGRVVMLAPPNAGSEIPDRFAAFPPFHWFTGINGRRLGTGAEALPRTLGPWDPAGSGEGTLGIIAGGWSLPILLASYVPRPNDGKVSVASTHLRGERDHVVLPFSHTWLGWRRETIAQVKAFLVRGEFSRQAAARG